MDEPIGLWAVNRDQPTIDVISERAMEFWTTCIVPKVPPAIKPAEIEQINECEVQCA